MSPDPTSMTALNLPASSMPETMTSFTLTAPPDTDLWRKPPSSDTNTAPILYTALRYPFRSAEVTVTADCELEWDQAGLCIFAGPVPGTSTTTVSQAASVDPVAHPPTQTQSPNPAQAQTQPQAHPPPYTAPTPTSPTKWVKASLELTASTLCATSVCALGTGSDWCALPLPPHFHASGYASGYASLRLKLERVGFALWIFYQTQDQSSYQDQSEQRNLSRSYPASNNSSTTSPSNAPLSANGNGNGAPWIKMREVSSFFWGVEDKSVRVGVYASRPAGLSGAGGGSWQPGRIALRTEGFGGFGGMGMGGLGADGEEGEGGLVVEFEDLEIL